MSLLSIPISLDKNPYNHIVSDIFPQLICYLRSYSTVFFVSTSFRFDFLFISLLKTMTKIAITASSPCYIKFTTIFTKKFTICGQANKGKKGINHSISFKNNCKYDVLKHRLDVEINFNFVQFSL